MRWTALSLAIAFVCATVNQAVAEKRVALVIGNDAYVHGARLNNPGRDARAIGATLKKLGFKLVGDRPHVDLDKATTDRMVEAFGIMAQDADIALFYFSGHGMQIGGTNYLVPIDLDRSFTPATVDFRTLNADLVLAALDKARSRVKMMLLDACRTNPFLASKDQGGGLAQMKAPRATVIGFATQPNTTAWQGPAGGLSPYANALATYMDVKGLELFAMLNEGGLAVMAATDDRQQPWISSSPIPRRFVLKESPEAVPPIPPTPPILGPTPPTPQILGSTQPDTGASLALIQRAYKQMDSDDYAGARATLNEAINADGTFAPAYSYRGFAWYREG